MLPYVCFILTGQQSKKKKIEELICRKRYKSGRKMEGSRKRRAGEC